MQNNGEQENHTASPQNNMQCPGHVLNTQTVEVCPFSQVLKRLLKLEGGACDIFLCVCVTSFKLFFSASSP